MTEEELKVWINLFDRMVKLIDKTPTEINKSSETIQKIWMADQLHLEGFKVNKVEEVKIVEQ